MHRAIDSLLRTELVELSHLIEEPTSAQHRHRSKWVAAMILGKDHASETISRPGGSNGARNRVSFEFHSSFIFIKVSLEFHFFKKPWFFTQKSFIRVSFSRVSYEFHSSFIRPVGCRFSAGGLRLLIPCVFFGFLVRLPQSRCRSSIPTHARFVNRASGVLIWLPGQIFGGLLR